MNITSAQYLSDPITLNNMSIKATINGIINFIPLDEANTDYQAILQWVADGNTIAEAD